MAVVENRIFVNGIPQTASKDDLAAYFSQFGTTVDVYQPLQYGTGQHKGICFVTYSAADSVQLALSQPGHVIHGLPVTVDLCLSKDKGGGKGKDGGKSSFPGTSGTINGDRLFITKVPPEATKEEVEGLFSKYGQWSDLFMPSGNFPAGHKGICFISYTDSQSAALAIQCGPHQLRGQDLVVELATPRDVKGGKGGQPQFQQFSPAVQQPVAWAGAYPGVQAWPAAGLGQVVPPPGGYWQAQVVPNSGQFVPPPASQSVALKPGRLFLTKVPEDVTKEDLTTYFQQYGPLQDVYVPVGKSIAFVSFSDTNTAQLVVQTAEHEVKLGRVVTVDLAYDRPPLEAKGKGKFRYQPYS